MAVFLARSAIRVRVWGGGVIFLFFYPSPCYMQVFRSDAFGNQCWRALAFRIFPFSRNFCIRSCEYVVHVCAWLRADSLSTLVCTTIDKRKRHFLNVESTLGKKYASNGQGRHGSLHSSHAYRDYNIHIYIYAIYATTQIFATKSELFKTVETCYNFCSPNFWNFPIFIKPRRQNPRSGTTRRLMNFQARSHVDLKKNYYYMNREMRRIECAE